MPFVRTRRAFNDSKQATVCMSKKMRCVFLAAFCLSLLPYSGYGQNQPPAAPYVPITMQQAVDLALAKNPTLLSAQQNLLSVKAQELQAGVRQNPNLVVTGSNVTIGEDSNNPYYYSVGVNRLFERGEKLVGGGWIVPVRPRHRLMLNTMLSNSRSFFPSGRPLPASLLPRQQKNSQTTTSMTLSMNWISVASAWKARRHCQTGL